MPPSVARASLFACRGSLCVKDGSRFEPIGDVESFVLSIEKFDKKAWIVVRLDNVPELEQEITGNESMQYHTASGSVFWYTTVENEVRQMAFKFCVDASVRLDPQNATQSFVEKYNRFYYELLTGVTVPVETNDDVDYLATAGSTQAQQDEREENIFGMQREAVYSATGDNNQNTCFADSVQFHRALVLQQRGKGKECFIQAHGVASTGFSGDVQEFKIEGATGSIEEALLQHGDRKMFIIDAPDHSTSAAARLDGQLRELDMEAGKVVQTYQPAGDSSGIKSVKFLSKHSDENPNILSCISKNAAFVIDTRLDPKNCAVVEEAKTFGDYAYKTMAKNKHFTCHATSRNGYLAVGDYSGSVRLYTGPPGARKLDGSGHHAKLAKTLIELGSPILHLDITSDGELIVATTKERILVLSTSYVDDKGATKNGFAGRMGKQKPSPLALLPSPAQVQRMGGAPSINFVKATIEGTDSNGSERFIVAVCGPMLCTWNLATVREAVTTHSLVYCESKQTNGGSLLGAELRGDKVEFLSDKAVGLQLRSSDTKTKSGGFTFFTR